MRRIEHTVLVKINLSKLQITKYLDIAQSMKLCIKINTSL